MDRISVTLEVSKFDKSIDNNEVQSEKKLNIDVTFDVSKLVRLIEVNFAQLVNIECISITFDVLKFDTSIDFKDLHM